MENQDTLNLWQLEIYEFGNQTGGDMPIWRHPNLTKTSELIMKEKRMKQKKENICLIYNTILQFYIDTVQLGCVKVNGTDGFTVRLHSF
jgi:hypothetical protein